MPVSIFFSKQYDLPDESFLFEPRFLRECNKYLYDLYKNWILFKVWENFLLN